MDRIVHSSIPSCRCFNSAPVRWPSDLPRTATLVLRSLWPNTSRIIMEEERKAAGPKTVALFRTDWPFISVLGAEAEVSGTRHGRGRYDTWRQRGRRHQITSPAKEYVCDVTTQRRFRTFLLGPMYGRSCAGLDELLTMLLQGSQPLVLILCNENSLVA
jgi:hypothetical protein